MPRISALLPKSALAFAAAAAVLVTAQAHAARPKAKGTKPTATKSTNAKASATKPSAATPSTAKPSVAKLTPRARGSLSKVRDGVAKSASDLMLHPAPPPMSKAQLMAATDMQIKELNWAYLTPNSMARHDRAALTLVRSEYVTGASNRATFKQRCGGTRQAGSPPCHEGFVGIGIEASGPGLFIVNCSVRGTTAGKWILESGGARTEIESTVGQANQVLFVVQASSAGGHWARLSGTPQVWAFYGCTINTAS